MRKPSRRGGEAGRSSRLRLGAVSSRASYAVPDAFFRVLGGVSRVNLRSLNDRKLLPAARIGNAHRLELSAHGDGHFEESMSGPARIIRNERVERNDLLLPARILHADLKAPRLLIRESAGAPCVAANGFEREESFPGMIED